MSSRRHRVQISALVGAVLTALSLSANASAATHCPSDMALAGSSCVDKYEASLVEIKDDGTEVPYSPYEAPNGHRVRAISREGVVPQAHISMVEAKHACAASGKRLCRAQEWKSACKGPEATRYPYGNERAAGACVDTARTSPVNKLHGGEHSSRTMNDPALNQLENTVEPTGAAAQCTNAYGVHDMVGNLHEWTDDASFRGGYYLDTSINGEGCEYRTTAHSPIYYDYSTGFRCCADSDALSDEDEAAQSTARRNTHRGSETTSVAMTEPSSVAADPTFDTPDRRTAGKARHLPSRPYEAAAMRTLAALPVRAPRIRSSRRTTA